jgi:CPA2 family monovalent cation:H+ antiporter-2
MFGVGLHFSLSDLLSVKAIAVPGAVVQIACATLLGMGLAHLLGWSFGAGIVFGLALSVASTVVLLRALQERRLVATEQGRIAVGWLIVEDLVMVLTLVALPALAPILISDVTTGQPVSGDILRTLGVTLLKIIAFFAVMMLVGRRIIPWILHYIAHTGSRELFRLGVLTIALGVAFGAAKLFGVSFALGAFFAGMILSESPLSQQAANESLPLRDAFAVLFFVSVGMLFNPMALMDNFGAIMVTVAIIVFGKSLAALAIVMAFGYPLRTGLLIAASLAQIGEFSFILAGLGVTLDILPEEGRELILAGAIVSIVLNPLVFHLLDRYGPAAKSGTDIPTDQRAADDHTPDYVTGKENHTVLVGYGRVGKIIGNKLIARGEPLVIIDEREDAVTKLREQGIDAIAANAITGLRSANIKAARTLILVIPDCFEAGPIVEQARKANSALTIIAGAMTDTEEMYLKNYGATTVVQGSREIADAILAAHSPARPGAQ